MQEDTQDSPEYPKTALLDADFMVYAVGFAASADDSLQMQKNRITEWVTDIVYMRLNCDEYKAYISGGNNFRYKVAKTQPYKGTRAKNAKPLHYDELRKHLQRLGAEVTDNMEADDAVCIQAHMSDSWIVHVDKDLDQIPGWHYNPQKDLQYYVDPFVAEYNFWIQMLMGDRVDNIPGLPNIGPKKAAGILKDIVTVQGLEEATRKAYKDKGFNDEYFDEQYKLLRLLQWQPVASVSVLHSDKQESSTGLEVA